MHAVRAPALIDQLANVHGAGVGRLDCYSAGFGSRPPSGLEALEALRDIDRQAATCIRQLGHDDSGTTRAVLDRLAGLYPAVASCGRRSPRWADQGPGEPPVVVCCASYQLEVDVRRW